MLTAIFMVNLSSDLLSLIPKQRLFLDFGPFRNISQINVSNENQQNAARVGVAVEPLGVRNLLHATRLLATSEICLWQNQTYM